MGFLRFGSPEKIEKISEKFDETTAESIDCPICHTELATKCGGLVKVGKRLLIAKYIICTKCNRKVKV